MHLRTFVKASCSLMSSWVIIRSWPNANLSCKWETAHQQSSDIQPFLGVIPELGKGMILNISKHPKQPGVFWFHDFLHITFKTFFLSLHRICLFLLEECWAWLFHWMQPCWYESNFGNYVNKLFLYFFEKKIEEPDNKLYWVHKIKTRDKCDTNISQLIYYNIGDFLKVCLIIEWDIYWSCFLWISAGIT